VQLPNVNQSTTFSTVADHFYIVNFWLLSRIQANKQDDSLSGSKASTYAQTMVTSISWQWAPVATRAALKTNNGHYLTMVNGGGLGGPNTGPGAVAMHTDATVAGPWERFQLEWVGGTSNFGLKTANGNYVTAVNGGGIGGPNDASSPVHTDATAVGPWEQLTINYDPLTQLATIQTEDGHYLTAVNGGGFGGPNNVPIHTDAVVLGPWETFSAVNV
jgi:hypothetical protein